MTAQELFDRLMAYPQPTRTEILNRIEEVTRNYDPERINALIADFDDLLSSWKYEEVVKSLKREYDINYSRYEDELRRAEYAVAMGANGPIEWPEEPSPFIAPAPFPGYYDDSNVFVPPMYCYAVEFLKGKTAGHSKNHLKKLPPELDTPEAKAIFDKSKELGLIDHNFRWLKGKQYLACFARRMSLYLKLGKGLNPDNTPRINWQPFEKLFNIPNGKLRSNYNDVKAKYGENPEIERTLNELMP